MEKGGHFPALSVWTSCVMRQEIWWTSREKNSRKRKGPTQGEVEADGQT